MEAQEKLVPWDEIRALHVRGMTLRAIADKYGLSYGALRSRSSREQWNNGVKVASSHVLHVATEDLANSARNWIGKIDTLVHAAVDNVMARGMNKLSIRDLNLALECAEKANRMARVNFGLDADNGAHPRVQVNVAVLGNNAQVCNQDVIDVEALRAATPAHPAGAPAPAPSGV